MKKNNSITSRNPHLFFTFFSDTLSLNMVIDDSKSHVLPKVINTLSNAIASTFDLPSISVINQPFKGESFDAGFDGGLFAGAMFFGFTYVFLVMQQGMELIYDREVHKSVLPAFDIF